jgi:mRNA-degrading endonuclease RelE of RelBE toxin-antitoxin system
VYFHFYHPVVEFQQGATRDSEYKGGGMAETFRPGDWPRFVRFPVFTRDWERFGLDDAVLQALESEILKDPDRSPVIRGTGGLRKLRFTEPGSGRGKRGAYRVCYVLFPEYGTIALVVIFGKTEKSDLTRADQRAIAVMIENYRAELEREFAWRHSIQVNPARGGSNGKAD